MGKGFWSKPALRCSGVGPRQLIEIAIKRLNTRLKTGYKSIFDVQFWDPGTLAVMELNCYALVLKGESCGQGKGERLLFREERPFPFIPLIADAIQC